MNKHFNRHTVPLALVAALVFTAILIATYYIVVWCAKLFIV